MRLIAFNRVRHPKVLRASRGGGLKPRVLQCPDETAEAEQVIADIQQRLTDPSVQPRDIATSNLTRNNSRCAASSITLSRGTLSIPASRARNFRSNTRRRPSV